MPTGPAKVPASVVPKYNEPNPITSGIAQPAVNQSGGLFTSNSRINESIGASAQPYPQPSSSGVMGITGSLARDEKPPFSSIPITIPAAERDANFNRPLQQNSTTLLSQDINKPSSILGGPTNSVLNPEKPSEPWKAQQIESYKPPEGAAQPSYSGGSVNIPSIYQPPNLKPPEQENNAFNPSGINSTIKDTNPLANSGSIFNNTYVNNPSGNYAPNSKVESAINYSKPTDEPKNEAYRGSGGVEEELRVDRLPGSYTSGTANLAGSSMKPQEPDLSWAKNICVEEYNERQVELIQVPNIRVQIA